MSKFKSQSGQDVFALQQANYLTGGYFLEIGAYHSEHLSNTYALEVEYGWSGIAVEIIKERADEYNAKRISKCILGDATKLKYQELLELHNAPKIIDYLSLDIEPATQTLDALKLILQTSYSFNCITFEHDLYVGKENVEVKLIQKELLLNMGYTLYKENVCSGNNPRLPFEDWWVR